MILTPESPITPGAEMRANSRQHFRNRIPEDLPVIGSNRNHYRYASKTHLFQHVQAEMAKLNSELCAWFDENAKPAENDAEESEVPP
jgi:hypothetical protein